MFAASVEVLWGRVKLNPSGRGIIQVRNHSDISFELEIIDGPERISMPDTITLHAGKITPIDVRAPSGTTARNWSESIRFRVTNVLVGPNQPLELETSLNVMKSE